MFFQHGSTATSNGADDLSDEGLDGFNATCEPKLPPTTEKCEQELAAGVIVPFHPKRVLYE